MNRTLRSTARTAALLIAAAGIFACADSTAPRPGQVRLLLTDAAGDIRAAVVTIDRIYLQGSATDSSNRVVLRDDDVTTNLITLANSTADLVADATVPGGRYTELRFVISGGYIEVENADGSTSIYASSPNYAGLPAGAVVAGNLQMPSLASSGLKVKLADAIDVDGDQNVLLVDFDVARSFGHATGGSGWVMHPVIQAGELALSGTVRATVALQNGVTLPSVNGTALTLGDFDAVLTDTGGVSERVELTDTDANGTWEASFRFLFPGTYTLDLAAPSDSVTFVTTPTRPVTVTLTSGATATTAFTITSATKP